MWNQKDTVWPLFEPIIHIEVNQKKVISGHHKFNTEKLELPSISLVQNRGPADVPWFNHPTYSQRSPFSGDRLPDLRLPQSYTSSASYGALSARSNGTNGVYTAQQPVTTAYSGTHQNIGLKTPSPSPTSLNGAPQSNGLLEEPTDHPGFVNPEHNAQQYDPVNGSYNNAMNQHQQYMDSQHSQLPGGQAYPPQVSSAGTIPSYGQYQQQLPVMHPGSNSYAQSPAGYNHYAYSGVASPHSGQSVSSSMNSQMNPNIPPSKTTLAPSLLVRPKLNFASDAIQWTSAASLRRRPRGTCASIPATDGGHFRSTSSTRHETSSYSHIMGR